MVNGRNKGHAYELAVINKLKQYGCKKAVSSRMESKSRDDAKVDICHAPVNIQCKAMEKLRPTMHDILASMPMEEVPNVVFHKVNRKGTVVAMSEQDFFDLMVKAGYLQPPTTEYEVL